MPVEDGGVPGDKLMSSSSLFAVGDFMDGLIGVVGALSYSCGGTLSVVFLKFPFCACSYGCLVFV